MNKILTAPKEIEINERVLYAGNHYSSVVLEDFYIPSYHFELDGGVWARARIYADLSEKGFVYEFESPDDIEVRLACTMDTLSLLRFNSHKADFKVEMKLDKRLGNPAVNIVSAKTSFSAAFRGDKDFERQYIDGTVLYPGFELDEAGSYFILLGDMDDIDDDILRAFDSVFMRIEREYDCDTGLYSTFLMPSDDPSEYPFLTIDNVILWRGLKNLLKVYQRMGFVEKAELAKKTTAFTMIRRETLDCCIITAL
ncbi:MAG: hypothetical protein ACYCYE_12550 [Clostridia bacterium]